MVCLEALAWMMDVLDRFVGAWTAGLWMRALEDKWMLEQGTLPLPLCFSLRHVLTFLPQKHVVTHIYTHSRKERKYSTYLRDYIHFRTIYIFKVNYIETKYTSTRRPNATGIYASLPSRRAEPHHITLQQTLKLVIFETYYYDFIASFFALWRGLFLKFTT